MNSTRKIGNGFCRPSLRTIALLGLVLPPSLAHARRAEVAGA